MNTHNIQKHIQRSSGGLPPYVIRSYSWSAGESRRMRQAWPGSAEDAWTWSLPSSHSVASAAREIRTVERNAGGWLEGKGPNDAGIRVPCVHKAGWANNILKQQTHTKGGRPRPGAGHPGGHPQVTYETNFKPSTSVPCVCKPGKATQTQTEACIPLRHESSNRVDIQSPRVTRLGLGCFPGSSFITVCVWTGIHMAT